MKLSRIDYIGLNGGDGIHYDEEVVMSMTRKDFQTIANIIRVYKMGLPSVATYTIEDISNLLADYFKQANSSFDKERFMRACGFYKET